MIFESAVASSKPLFRDLFDVVILVRADYSTRLSRNPKAAQRNHLQSEAPEVDYIIDNNGSLEDLALQAEQMIEKLSL